ncbi:MAG: hypothetical protein GXY83_04955 [Rhodopirellula sp.]|nr:hypothetical protein [Rhodopirellula sp.]
MSASNPRYILYSDAVDGPENGRWRFLLCSADSTEQVEADELEPGVYGERLELLAVVRGLEALNQPSHVTLVTSSAYVREGIRHGLAEWRRNEWCWEFFGQMVPVKNRDLWRRIDRTLAFHNVECRVRDWRFDPPHQIAPPAGALFGAAGDEAPQPAGARQTSDSSSSLSRGWRQLSYRWLVRWKRQISSGLSALVPSPRFG